MNAIIKNASIQLITLLFATGGLLLAGGGTAMAQENCNVERDVKVSGFRNETVYNRLQDSYEDISEENWNKAANDLNGLLERTSVDYELAVVHQALAQVEWARERFDSALRHFERAVELNALPNSTHFALMYQIAQLYYMQERYDDALQRLDMWFCTAPQENITEAAYVLQASIYAQKPDHRNALKAINTAIEMSDNPKEQWYQLKLSMHFELEQFPQAADTLEVMINRWPDKKQYWTQLSSIYMKLKQDQQALSVMKLAHRRGMLESESEWKRLANLYQFLDIPYKAAETMQEGIERGVVSASAKNWEQVANAWYAAEELERSLSAYESASGASNDGEIDLRRGYILVDLERWEPARQALSAAINKGGLEERKIADAWLLKGMSELQLGNYGQARQDLNRATRFSKTASAARQWLNYIDEQQSARQAP